MLVAAGAGLQARVGWEAAAAIAAVAVLALWQRSRRAGQRQDADDAADVSAAPSGLRDPRSLPAQVVPVWQRNVDSARQHAERNMESLVERFGNIVAQLDLALAATDGTPRLELGATDEMLERHRPEIDALTQTTRQAVALKDRMLEAIHRLATATTELSGLAREVQTIGRATHLLALNASVEATRAGEAGSGFALVAQEVRALAGQSRHIGSRIASQVASMQERLSAVQSEASALDTHEEEISILADRRAREVVRGLVGSLAEVSRSSRALHEASRQVQHDIEGALMNLQSQDRFSQMLVSVTDDMNRLAEWLKGAEDEAAAAPNHWLERLEQTYTMEEMRTSHHGTVAIQQSSGVEFF